MITGAHSIIYRKKPEADRAFLRDIGKLGLLYQPRDARPQTIAP
jgi:hypothetical protein